MGPSTAHHVYADYCRQLFSAHLGTRHPHAGGSCLTLTSASRWAGESLGMCTLRGRGRASSLWRSRCSILLMHAALCDCGAKLGLEHLRSCCPLVQHEQHWSSSAKDVGHLRTLVVVRPAHANIAVLLTTSSPAHAVAQRLHTNCSCTSGVSKSLHFTACCCMPAAGYTRRLPCLQEESSVASYL